MLEQAVKATKGFDQGKLAAHMHKATFKTVVGDVKFAKTGEWATSRVLMVQFRDVKPNDMAQFEGPGKRIVLYPKAWKSGDIVYPYKK